MATKSMATLTSKGQITVPVEIRQQWNLKAGDQISFEGVKADKGTIRPRRRRSIFDSREELTLPSLGRSLTQADIDEAIGAEIDEKFGQFGRKAGG